MGNRFSSDSMSNKAPARSIGITIDGGGSAITTGVKGTLRCPFSGTIENWTLMSDVAGSCVIDVWKTTFALAPPTVSDSITSSDKPTLSSALKSSGYTSTTWDCDVAANDVLSFNVVSAATIQRVSLTISIVPS